MTIAPRDKGFLATVHHKGERWRRQFPTYAEAEIWEAQAKADILAGRAPSQGNTHTPSGLPSTVGEMIEYVYTHAWSNQKSGEESYRVAQRTGEVFGLDRSLKKIDQWSIDNFIQKLKERGDSNATINRKTSKLSKVLRTALDHGIIERMPKIPRLPEPLNRIRWYTDEELADIEEYCNHSGHPKMAYLIRFLADTGLRRGEALKLTWDDVLEDSVFVLDSKSGSSRSVPLTPEAKDAIGALPREGHGPFSWCSESHLRQWWQRIRIHMDWVGDRQCVVHTLRHTFCSRLVQKKVPILTVKELAGHKTIDMTLRYAHLAPDNRREAIAVLSSRSTMLNGVASLMKAGVA